MRLKICLHRRVQEKVRLHLRDSHCGSLVNMEGVTHSHILFLDDVSSGAVAGATGSLFAYSLDCCVIFVFEFGITDPATHQR